jgi:hypothetical protein
MGREKGPKLREVAICLPKVASPLRNAVHFIHDNGAKALEFGVCEVLSKFFVFQTHFRRRKNTLMAILLKFLEGLTSISDSQR